MPFYLMLAMQAGGMIVDYFGTQNESDLMEKGMKLQQAQLQANIEQTRLETQEESLQSMKQLRQNLGTQIAVFAARGTATYGGSAASILNENISNFNSDERIRQLNQYAKEKSLRTSMKISRLQNKGDTSRLWQGFASRTLNKFPTSVSGWQQLSSNLSGKGS